MTPTARGTRIRCVNTQAGASHGLPCSIRLLDIDHRPVITVTQ